ncbi:MAG: YceI family protein [Campylobacteraceae bacterium]
MKKILVFLVGLCLSTSLFAKEFVVDNGHTNVGFEIKHMMVANFKGNFQKFEGEVEVDEATKKINKLTASIDVNSIYTAIDARDNHLKSKSFFDVENFPKITFEMTKFVQNEDKNEGKVEGYLTIKGVKKLVVLESEINGFIKDDGKGKQRVGLSLSGEINRFDFGISWNNSFAPNQFNLGEKVKLEIEIEAIEK